MWKIRNNVLQKPDDEGSPGGGAAAAAAPTAPPAAAPAASAPPAAAPAPAAAAPAAAASPATAAKDGYWPADWRETVSKADEKILGRMQRYASPEAALQALIAAQNRISAGELKPVLGKNATAEEIASWRTEHGIPATPDKYDLGKELSGVDPKLLEVVLKEAHGTNQTPDQVKATLKAWNQISQDVAASRAEKDIEIQKTGEDALRAEWGPEFRRNINLIHGLLDGAADQTLKDNFLNGRLSDGTPIGSSPEALKMLVGLALIQNPAGVVVPGGSGDMAKNLDGRIAEIEKMMKTDRKAYNDPKISGPGGEYSKLLEARERMQGRKAA